MEALKFKTTIKCAGCISNVAPYLNRLVGENKWQVDITSPDKILTIEPASQVSAARVIGAVTEAGYKAEEMGSISSVN